MRSILKTLVVANDKAKWMLYDRHFRHFYEGRETNYDLMVDFIDDYHKQFEFVPKVEAIAAELNATNEHALVKYLGELVEDPTALIYEDISDFTAALRTKRIFYHELEVSEATKLAVTKPLDQKERAAEDLSEKSALENVDQMISKLHQAKAKLQSSTAGVSLQLYGEQAHRQFAEAYQKLKEQTLNNEQLFFKLPFHHFDDVEIKLGDMITFAAYTSEGKSILLRFMAYWFAVMYGMNGYFLSIEMTAEVVRNLFFIMHANNKKIFPSTPMVVYNDLKKGILDPEAEDFLINVAIPDFLNNPAYGTILVEQPPSSRFSLVDFEQRVNEVEHQIMPLDFSAVDYLTMLYPSSTGGRLVRIDRTDYNQMFKDYKQIGLGHRRANGDKHPMINMTAAQISRKGREEAIKQDGIYTLQAIAEYSEIERSSDVVFTSLLTSEMRAANQLRLQNLKNRDGAIVIDPKNLFCDFPHGFALSEIRERTQAEIVQALQTMQVLR